jgi:hypothetical protein
MIWLALFAFQMYGQVDYAEEKTKIASIKKDSRYIYGEGIADTPEEALLAAEIIIESEIRRVISERESLQDAETIIVNNIKKNSSVVKLKRGTMDRVFLYVDKDNISAGNQVMEIHRNTEDREAEPEPEPEPEPLPLPELEETSSSATTQPEPEPVSPPTPSQPMPRIISDIVAAADFASLQTYLKGQKAAHKIMWDKVTSDINPAWYIIAVSNGRIEAVFDKGLTVRKNFLTGEKENLNNYDHCTKIWLTIYE